MITIHGPEGFEVWTVAFVVWSRLDWLDIWTGVFDVAGLLGADLEWTHVSTVGIQDAGAHRPCVSPLPVDSCCLLAELPGRSARSLEDWT